ncbi:MAG: DUF4388 domain-containing protein [Vicinamibacteria bacterium]|nr:DUF4388 domain-containing protein [Vicinamibacteria bacterium]
METNVISKRFEAFAIPGGLRGQLSELPLPDIFQYLRQVKSTGILTLVSGGARKAVYMKGGRVVFAGSNLPTDRLGEILLREGRVTTEEYEASIRGISKGKRQGRILVEMGALTPKDLWDGVQFQIKEICYSVFQWEEGRFHFEESNLPEKERITIDVDPDELILVGIRRVDANGAIQTRYPELDLVLERVPGEFPVKLEPYEEHVLRLVDGERSVLEICQASEIGENETLKVLYTFHCVGIVRSKGKKVRPLDQDFVPGEDLWSVLNSFNQMYGFVFQYLVREVGPIAENVLEKYLNSLRQSRKDVLVGVKLQKDGTLDSAMIEKNLGHVDEEKRRDLLVESLNELLYAEILAVKRTLGAEHEAAVIRMLRER